MKLKINLIWIVLLFSCPVLSQNMADYSGGWKGKIEKSNAFSFKVEVVLPQADSAVFKISNQNNIISQALKLDRDKPFVIPISESLSFTGEFSKSGKEINGFIKSGLLLYHVKLVQITPQSFIGIWNILMVGKLNRNNFYLSVENGSGEDYDAYPIFADDRFTGTWCADFKKVKDRISFTDFKTGLLFKGKLQQDHIELGIYLNADLVATVNLTRSTGDWDLKGSKTVESRIAKVQLKELETLISNDSLPNTHAIIISKKGNTIYEKYFHGFTANVPHDMRSASKSISSAIVGIAKEKFLFKSVHQSIFDFLPEKYQILKDSLKSQIDLKSLLTMSSGLDAIDFGISRKSLASEDNYQPAEDWTKTILSAPMLYAPNTHANYGSANPYLLGIAIDSVVSQPVELFMDENLFQKLNISNYIIQTDVKGRPYFGGGMYLIPKDMLKFGELYLNNGKWNGKQILSKKWLKESFEDYRILENTPEKNGYGYLWWHYTYKINGVKIKSIEARGAGGQYIFILPELETVVVITSGNYRNGKTQQPELILEKYILPNIRN